jgi:hypothetical protein
LFSSDASEDPGSRLPPPHLLQKGILEEGKTWRSKCQVRVKQLQSLHRERESQRKSERERERERASERLLLA